MNEPMNMKYEDAIHELDAIVARIERNELDIDQLITQLKRAKELIAFCKDILYKTDEEVNKLLEE